MDTLENKNPSGTAMLERGYLKFGNAKYSILEYMREGNSLTSREAFLLMGTTCLNTHISEACRNLGLEIPREWIEVTTRYGKKARVCQYRTSKSDNERLDYLLEERPHGF